MLSDGDLVLRPIEPADLEAIYRWATDTPTHLMADSRPLLPVTWESFRDRWQARTGGPDVEDFTITLETRQVGQCQLVLFDHLARSAMVGITVAPEERGKHIGRRAVQLLVDHAFRDRGLHRVWLGTMARNEAGRRAYRAAGFVEETYEREQSWVDGEYVDEIRMGVLRSEWEAQRGEHAQR